MLFAHFGNRTARKIRKQSLLPATIAADLCFEPLYKHHRDEVFAHKETAIFDIAVYFFTFTLANIADVYEDFFCFRLIVEKVVKGNLNLHISGAFVAQRYIDNVLFANSSLMGIQKMSRCFLGFVFGRNEHVGHLTCKPRCRNLFGNICTGWRWCLHSFFCFDAKKGGPLRNEKSAL